MELVSQWTGSQVIRDCVMLTIKTKHNFWIWWFFSIYVKNGIELFIEIALNLQTAFRVAMLSILTLPTHQHEISFCHWVKMKPNQGSQVSNLVSRTYRTDIWRKVIIVFSISLYSYGNTRHIRTEKSHSSPKDCLCCFEIYIFSFLY